MTREALGIKHFTGHGIRLACVNAMLRAGVPVADVAAITGHSTQVRMRHYAEADEKGKISAAAALSVPAIQSLDGEQASA